MAGQGNAAAIIDVAGKLMRKEPWRPFFTNSLSPMHFMVLRNTEAW